MATDLLSWGWWDSFWGLLCSPPEGRQADRQRNTNTVTSHEDKVKDRLGGAQERKLMPLEHTSGPFWPRVGPAQCIPDRKIHPNLSTASCQFTGALTSQVSGESASLGLASLVHTSQMICEDLVSMRDRQLHLCTGPGELRPGWLSHGSAEEDCILGVHQ